MTAKKVLVILVHGAEEMETVISVDILCRGVLEVVLARLNRKDAVICNIKICPDTSLAEASHHCPVYPQDRVGEKCDLLPRPRLQREAGECGL